jgi:hypothetical protein
MSYDTVTNLLDLWRETNTVTDFFFSYFFLIALAITVYMIMQNSEAKSVFLSATLLISVVSLFMFLAGLLPFGAFTVCLVLLGGSLMSYVFAPGGQ